MMIVVIMPMMETLTMMNMLKRLDDDSDAKCSMMMMSIIGDHGDDRG